MADVKISGLPASTTPLAGTEVLPIVQSSQTRQVSVSNLTAGRSVAARAITLTQTTTGSGGFKIAAEVLASDYPSARFLNTTANDGFLIGWDTDHVTIATNTTSGVAGSERLAIFKTSGDVKVNTGNLVIGTSGKGIDFSATSQPAGATSELLADYEEGTWTPVLNRSITSPTVSYSAQTGKYTKIGNQVFVSFELIWTANSGGSGSFTITGLPFTVATGGASYSVLNAIDFNGITFASGTMFAIECAANSTIGALLTNGSAGSPAGVATVANTGYMYVSGSYFV
jgi:hypothetical protein